MVALDNRSSVRSDMTSTARDYIESAQADLTRALALLPPDPPTGNGSVTGRWFTDASWPNTPVSQTPKIDPSSSSWIAMLVKACPNGVYTNTNAGTTPVWYASATTPTATVTLAIPYRGSQTVTVPYVAGSVAAPPPDSHYAYLRVDTGLGGEFQDFTVAANGKLSAHSYAEWDAVLGDAVPTATDRISVLPTVAGLTRPYDFTTPSILHAARIAVPCASSSFRWPAIQSDGNTPGGPPSGAHLILPRSVSLTGLDRWQTLQARQFQEYGAYIGDSNGGQAITAYAEATCDGSSYPMPFTNLPAAIVAKMQVVAA